jgi:hypothetical protein
MTKHNSRGVAAYNLKTGEILHIHFTRHPAPESDPDHAEAELRRLVAHHGPDIGVLHIASGSHAHRHRFRVDTATAALRPAEKGETGFSASAGTVAFKLR